MCVCESVLCGITVCRYELFHVACHGAVLIDVTPCDVSVVELSFVL